MRPLLLLTTLALCASITAQDQLMLVPRWKVGDERTLDAARTTVIMENGTERQERTTWKGKVRVVNETPEALIIRLEVFDPVAEVLRQAQRKAGVAVAEPVNTQLRYSVDRITGKPTLVNRADLLKAAQAAVKEALPAVEAISPEAAANFKADMAPVLACLENAACSNDLYSEQIAMVSATHGAVFLQGGQNTTHARVPHPVPGATPDTVRMTTTAALKHLDRVMDQALVTSTTTYDLTAAAPKDPKEIKDIKAPNETKEPKVKTPRFEIGRNAQYTMDIRTAWPVRVVTEDRLAVDTAGQRNAVQTTTTVLFTQ